MRLLKEGLGLVQFTLVIHFVADFDTQGVACLHKGFCNAEATS